MPKWNDCLVTEVNLYSGVWLWTMNPEPGLLWIKSVENLTGLGAYVDSLVTEVSQCCCVWTLWNLNLVCHESKVLRTLQNGGAHMHNLVTKFVCWIMNLLKKNEPRLLELRFLMNHESLTLSTYWTMKAKSREPVELWIIRIESLMNNDS